MFYKYVYEDDPCFLMVQVVDGDGEDGSLADASALDDADVEEEDLTPSD